MLLRALAPLVDGKPGDHVLVSGPSGVGKTTTARHVLERLEREALDLRWGYVNCISDATTTGALHALCRDARLGADLPPDSTPPTSYYQRLRECEEQVVAVLDEIHALRDPRLFYSLHDVRGVTVLCITLDEDRLLADAESQVRSRARAATSVQLTAYGVTELTDILDARAEVALSGSVSREGLEAMADAGAGDARLAIAVLREAARVADAGGDRRITTDHLDEGVRDTAREDVRRRHVGHLGTHQRLLFEIIRENGPVLSSAVHELYERRADEARSRSRRRDILRSLRNYDLVEREGEGPATEYRLAGSVGVASPEPE